MAFRIVARDHIRAECVEDALKLIGELVSATRAEQGCLAYTYCQDTGAPGYFAMLERWESRESMEAHMKSEHFMRIIPLLTAMMEEPSRLEVYQELV